MLPKNMISFHTIPLSSTKNKVIHIIAFIFIIALFYIPYKEIRLERIRAFGEKRAIGIVISKSIRKDEHNNPATTKTEYIIRYRFVDPLGLPRERVASVDGSFWGSIAQGDSVIVYFAKAQPGVSRIEHEKENAVVQLLARFSRTGTY
ncbi:hypothetical protein [Maridesulfovibrio hydrothermalis]|uniref:DUF3592 domain-containing protein n=1 Tax=Maridesulfovibrio hydrothermalis AM13 = DSM 14728 TaxID=1121451 RepID=L0RCL2_9BACT|nr:hypothetical protein [Maridesulfovibrio hydrothermalis]CCO23947.1 conserved protein of unknown function [Maridesulfovibrio hydrothermalis AM13 = DSM 14728]